MTKNKQYQSLNRSITRLNYHIVLAFKYRKNIADVMGEDNVKRIIESAVGRCSGVKCRSIGVDKNHVHIVVSCPPKWSPSSVVGRVKQLSTHKAWDNCGDKLSNVYWGGKRILWSDGFYCETIGSVSEDKVLEYVKAQGS